jgi:steroid 5-alpha reductase family enzyme
MTDDGQLPALALAFASAFIVQWIAFVPAYLQRSERFFDLTGGATYIGVTTGLLLARETSDPRSYLLAAMIVVWAARLSSFLFRRVHAVGKDGRFDEIKQSAPRFFVVWTLQGVWVSGTAGAAFAAMTATAPPALGVRDAVGAALWLMGFAIEIVADRQKSRFRADPANRDRWIDRGLWSWSRHPNYFGEILLWVGVAVLASSALSGWLYLTLVSPLFVAVLLLKVSGVPMLAARAQARWGDDPAWRAYVARTSLLVPRPPRAEVGRSS